MALILTAVIAAAVSVAAFLGLIVGVSWLIYRNERWMR